MPVITDTKFFFFFHFMFVSFRVHVKQQQQQQRRVRKDYKQIEGSGEQEDPDV